MDIELKPMGSKTDLDKEGEDTDSDEDINDVD